MNIAIIGRTGPLYDAACRLMEAGHRICSVVTWKAQPEYTRKEEDFEALASSLDCPFFITSDITDSNVVASLQDADIGVSINWISIIPQSVIDVFSIGILNTHSGDLPAYRGNACPNWAIINGEPQVTLSCHLMEGDKLDCGRIIAQKHFSIEANTYIADVLDWSDTTIPELVNSSVTALNEDPEYTLKYADVHDKDSLRCFPRCPEDSYIDWNAPIKNTDRLIRASSTPFQGAYTYIVEDGKLRRLHILKASVHSTTLKDHAVAGQILQIDEINGTILVKCGSGVLRIESCRIDDGISFSPGTHFKSIRSKLGVRPEDYAWMMNGITGVFQQP